MVEHVRVIRGYRLWFRLIVFLVKRVNFFIVLSYRDFNLLADLLMLPSGLHQA